MATTYLMMAQATARFHSRPIVVAYQGAREAPRKPHWLGQPERFGHHYLRCQHLHTDLFDRSFWRLIETKASTTRVVLRTAVGQLFDYRRCYKRHPTLVILLPERPGDSDLEYLEFSRVTAIWRTPAGRFSDSSSDRRFTTPTR
jgi:hypothetical protein